MYTIKQPNRIIFGKNSVNSFQFKENSLVITSKGAKKRKMQTENIEVDGCIHGSKAHHKEAYILAMTYHF